MNNSSITNAQMAKAIEYLRQHEDPLPLPECVQFLNNTFNAEALLAKGSVSGGRDA